MKEEHTFLDLGVDVDGPQAEVLVLVDHAARGVAVEDAVGLDVDVATPGPQHAGRAGCHGAAV